MRKQHRNHRKELRDLAASQFLQARRIAKGQGGNLVQFSESHYRVLGQPGWEIDIWPSTRKFQRKIAAPTITGLDKNWSLLQIVKAIFRKKGERPRRIYQLSSDYDSVEPSPQGTEAAVCQDIADRQQLGINKYGTTVSNNPLKRRQWLQHAYEEALDQAIYLKRLIELESGRNCRHDFSRFDKCSNCGIAVEEVTHER